MTTENNTTTVTISSRTRNRGLGWSTQPRGRGTGITPPSGPDVSGGLRTIERELERVHRATSGGVYHRIRLFVGARAVVAWDVAGEWCDGERDLGLLLDEVRRGEVVTVRVQQDGERHANA